MNSPVRTLTQAEQDIGEKLQTFFHDKAEEILADMKKHGHGELHIKVHVFQNYVTEVNFSPLLRYRGKDI